MTRLRARDTRVRFGEAGPRLAALGLLVLAGCGKAGPPLPPLHLVPGPVTEVSARRSGDEVRFTFVVPTTNVNGPGQANITRIEMFAATVAPGALPPTTRELVNDRHVVATADVRPPAKEGAPAPDATAKDTRPGPGDRITITETLDAAKLQPEFTTMPLVAPSPAVPVTTTQPATAAPPAIPVAKRIYVIRGVAPNGRPGQPTTRIELPLSDPPAPPGDVAVKFSETALAISWTAPVTETKTAFAFNIYPAGGTSPLNATLLTEPQFAREGIEFGKEVCFVLRTVRVAGAVQIESAPSERVCVTPTDTFPPAEPKGLSAVAGGGGVVSLIWDANSEADLAGYVVLRGEVPGDKLQALTPTPIKETTFRDTTAKPGVRYVYAIVAVDNAKNTSPQSTRVEESAR